MGLVRKVGRYSKAYSIDCISSLPFQLGVQANKCCRDNLCYQHRLWRNRLLTLFTRQFWSIPNSRNCLVGRIVLLNKDHPKIPLSGRFRPIRVASNVVKILESYLLTHLAGWASVNLKFQFGFVKGLGCDVARYQLFSRIYDAINSAR